jgi:hypothetical protein
MEIRSHCQHQQRASDFAPQKPRDKNGVTAAVTPFLDRMGPVRVTSKQLLYEKLCAKEALHAPISP